MTKRIVLGLAIVASLIAGSALAQNQPPAGMRLQEVPPNGQAQAPVVTRDPVAEIDQKMTAWKTERLNCLVAAGLKRPTSGFGVRGDDFIITDTYRVMISDLVWRRPGVNAQAAYACTPQAMEAAAAQQPPRR